nr:tyrosine-type recombinase/integrase [Frankia sp. CIT1]
MRIRRLLTTDLQHKTNGTFTELDGVLPGSRHDSILSNGRVPTEPGAVHFLDQRPTGGFTVDDAVAWATAPGGSRGWQAMRMRAVRGFAGYLHTLDPSVPVPPAGLVTGHGRRAVPYLYSDAEVAALMTAAGTLRYPMAVATYRTLIGLLAVTGMRIGEAARLDDTDFDPELGLLTVRASKNGRSRQLPLHPTTVAALDAYRHTRDTIHPRPVCPALLVSTAGTRLLTWNIGNRFRLLVARAGLTPRAGGARPRPLSRPGARCRDCSRPVSPSRSPNPPCRSLGNGLSTVSAVRRGWGKATGTGSWRPGRSTGRPSLLGAGSTRPHQPRSPTARKRS